MPGVIARLSTKSAVQGITQFPDATDLSITARSAALGAPIPSGAVRIYQTYYRDPSASFCPAPTGSTFNITNAVSIQW